MVQVHALWCSALRAISEARKVQGSPSIQYTVTLMHLDTGSMQQLKMHKIEGSLKQKPVHIRQSRCTSARWEVYST